MSSSSDWGSISQKANPPWSSGSSEPEGHHDIKFPDGTKWSSSNFSTPVTSERGTNAKTPTMPARGQDRWYQPAYPSPSDPWQQQKEEPRATRGMQEPRTRQANLREKERHATIGPRQQVPADSPRRQLAFERARHQGLHGPTRRAPTLPLQNLSKSLQYGEAKIRLKQDPRVYRHREFALRGERKETMEKILRDFIERGWLESCHSEWASPCFVVPKKVAGEWRLVVDYRGPNAQTQHDSYTLPLIEDMLQKKHRQRIFTVIDLKHGYHQMPLAEESRACTAMSTPPGPLQWKVMPMGVTNGKAAFQGMLENLLEPVRDCADPFVDDVIIASGDPSMSYKELLEAHERDVTRVLDLLGRHKLTGSSDKAPIAVSEVVFAGHVVGNGQRKPIPGKVAAIDHWEKPKTVSELRAYFGFCNYYSGYIKMYAEYAAPMTTMLKGNREETKKGSKKALVWNAESDRAFEGMKQALLSAVGLHLVDPDRGFVLRTEASDYAVGAVLEQVLDDGRHVPVAFWSRVLADSQRRTWTPREKEAYAIVMALRKWAGYIALHPVTVCTDHQSLQWWHKEHVDTPSGPGQDGMRPWPSSTSRLCMFLARTTPWRTVSVGGPIPPARA